MADHTGSIIGKSATRRPRAVYVHGLFMTGAEGLVLLRRLRRRGIECTPLFYPSRHERPGAVAARLASRLAGEPALNLVGHSLGGVVAMLAAAQTPEWQGRAVLLGPPLGGSDTARRAARFPGGRWVLGQGGRYLAEAPAHFSGVSRVLVIAGTRNIGIGRLIGACAAPGDGQVRLAETRLEGAAQASVHRGHLALLFDRRVAGMTADFLLGKNSGERSEA